MSQHALLSAGCKAWRSLSCPQSELWLNLTLGCGQTFRWRETADGHWTGVMQGKVWTLTQTENTLWYYVYGHQINAEEENGVKCKIKEEKSSKVMINMNQVEGDLCTVMSELDNKDEERLREYFQLDVKLGDLYRDWSTLDPHFKQIANVFTDDSVEMRLRDLGFGYRARFLQQSAQIIMNSHGPDWLKSLRSAPYMQARDALRALPGVGLKVADCVCLMSLDKSEAVPVDTHVWQISRRDYNCAAGSTQKTLTDKVYKDIGDFFRNLWGPYAGWAHSVLFCADLKRFQKLKEDIPVLKDEKKEPKKMKVKRDDRDEEKQKKRKNGKKRQRT
ncbi:N-glycosylase/DNA lyase isoform X2 [Misgurnus anguillicaudatus]|uniref:N-glycosylase/DNA lyase isoform X2 n=1 Tax=Misgurnus anguillicaudatus TaxID=75329 RepID=UPI003CCFA98F